MTLKAAAPTTSSLKKVKQRLHSSSKKRDRSQQKDKGKVKMARTARNVTVKRGSSSSQNSESESESEEEEEEGAEEGETQDSESEEEEEQQQAWNQRKQSQQQSSAPSSSSNTVNTETKEAPKDTKGGTSVLHDGAEPLAYTLQHAILAAKRDLAPSLVPTGSQGRQREFDSILSNLKEAVSMRQGGGIYVCGMPGTGKTLTTSLALERLIQLSHPDAQDDSDSLSPITNSSLSSSSSSSNSDNTAAAVADADTVFNMTATAPLPSVHTHSGTEFVVVKAVGTSIDEEGLYARMFAACFQFMSRSVKVRIKATDAGRGVSSSTRGKDGYGGEPKASLMKKCVQDYIKRSSSSQAKKKGGKTGE